jgi:hypothetical protein
MFPSSWDPTQVTKKKRKTFIEENEGYATNTMPLVPFQSGLQQTVCRRLNAPDTPASLTEISLDHILSRVPYKTMLENLFQNTEQVEEPVKNVPILSRAYEESFMRQPLPTERPCSMGDLCECMQIDKTNPFVGVEMRLPGDPEEPQLCVLCSRSTTQKCFYDMCFLGRSITGIIQRYGAIYGIPGEYAAECMLIPPKALGLASMPAPSVSHQRNRYSVVTHAGVKHLQQHRVGYEDFQRPSSKGAE